jgi:hypothetical protein
MKTSRIPRQGGLTAAGGLVRAGTRQFRDFRDDARKINGKVSGCGDGEAAFAILFVLKPA